MRSILRTLYRLVGRKRNYSGKPDRYPPEIDLFASEGFTVLFEDNADDSFNVYLLDEKIVSKFIVNEGSKDDKVREINQIYQSLVQKIVKNPYKMVQRIFNYPQFYQLYPKESGMRIMPFKFKSKKDLLIAKSKQALFGIKLIYLQIMH